MRTVEFDLVSTLLVSMVVLFLGRFLVAWVPVLRRLNIPAPVVGGGLIALVLALVDGLLHVKPEAAGSSPVDPAISDG